MNKFKFLVLFGVCAAAGLVMAGPGRGGPGPRGNNGGGRGGLAPRQMQAPRGPGGGNMVRRGPAGRGFAPQPTNPGGRGFAPRPMIGGPGVGRRPMPGGHGVGHRPMPPRRPVHMHRHHIPFGARFWARPTILPVVQVGALHTWTWVDMEWGMYIDGVYCYGEGYYFDGYNYFYNGACYTLPPTPLE